MKKLKLLKRNDKVWYSIPGFEGYYEINLLSEIKSLSRLVKFGHNRSNSKITTEKIIKQILRDDGYLIVFLHKDGKSRMFGVHQLMLMTFVGPKPEGQSGLHRNDIRTDNRIENLYWGTQKENIADAIKNGKMGTKEYLKKVSDGIARVGHPKGMLGKKHTSEVKARISNSLKSHYDLKNSNSKLSKST